MTPARRQYVYQSYGRAIDAFETVGWRPPAARRVDHRPTNDVTRADPAAPGVREAVANLPAWLHIVGGGVAAALMGALLGGALHI